MWLFGYTDPFGGDGPVDVFYGSCSSFMEAVELLCENVEKELADADKYQEGHFVQVLTSIRAVRDNPDIRFNSDNWVDTSFTDEIGEIEYIVTYVA